LKTETTYSRYCAKIAVPRGLAAIFKIACGSGTPQLNFSTYARDPSIPEFILPTDPVKDRAALTRAPFGR
jgi:hypothetical protein